jgi:hypothetical protein
MYIEGDIVEGLGRVETNHCGLPWVAGTLGLYCGVLSVRLFKPYKNGPCETCNNIHWVDKVYIDALTGKALDDKEVALRFNNVEFDYEGKSNTDWMVKNRERVKKNFTYIPSDETLWEMLSRKIFKRYFCKGEQDA